MSYSCQVKSGFLPLRKFMNEKGVDYLAISHSRELITLSRIAKIKHSSLLQSRYQHCLFHSKYIKSVDSYINTIFYHPKCIQ